MALLATDLQSQQGCQPPALGRSTEPNILNDDLEREFGELAAQHIGVRLSVMEDDSLSGYLRHVGERVARHLPVQNVRFQFLVIDAPGSDAFTLPGGRIYVTRKLIAMTRNEDELAGVLAHEMGHQLAHDSVVDFTRHLRKLLNVTTLRDAADLQQRYHQVIDTYRRNPEAMKEPYHRSDREQLTADQVAVYAVASAGYNPEAFADFLDRLFATKGQKGSWLSDLFGTTKPESRRLREVAKSALAIPAECVDTSAHNTPEEFRQWQATVLNYTGLGRKESLHNVLSKQTLDPALREQIQHLRFSPDGKYVLAQDSASVYVLTREPFAPLFRIDANDAYHASFTPDSKAVVFYDHGLRVQKWGIESRGLEEADDVFVHGGCLQTLLSPDGKFLACVQFDDPTRPWNLSVSLLNVMSGEPAVLKKSFAPWTSEAAFFYTLLTLFAPEAELGLVRMSFSPDGHYFLAARKDSRLAIDLTTATEIPLPSSVRDLLNASFDFIDGARLVGIAGNQGAKSAVVRFPTGEVLFSGLELRGSLSGPAHGDYVIIRPLENAAVGVMDLKTKKIFIGSMLDGLDIYDNVYGRELRNGELGLYQGDANSPFATAQLPRGPLGPLRAADVSGNLRMLAISSGMRGGVWDLWAEKRGVHLRGFRGAHLGGGGFALVAEFPPEPYAASGVQSGKKLDAAEKPGSTVVTLDVYSGRQLARKSFTADTKLREVGAYLLVQYSKTGGKSSGAGVLEILDLESFAKLWSREFEHLPAVATDASRSDALLLIRDLDSDDAKAEIRSDATLQKLTAPIKNPAGSYLVEVVEFKTGKTLAKFPVDTTKGSFRIESGLFAGNRVVFTDDENRILLYSLHGERMAQSFGRRPRVSHDGALLCVEREPGRLAIYDTRSMRVVDEFTFGSRVSHVSFDETSKRLLVLTSDQTVYVLDISSATAATLP